MHLPLLLQLAPAARNVPVPPPAAVARTLDYSTLPLPEAARL
jgi:hypothetical protein